MSAFDFSVKELKEGASEETSQGEEKIEFCGVVFIDPHENGNPGVLYEVIAEVGGDVRKSIDFASNQRVDSVSCLMREGHVFSLLRRGLVRGYGIPKVSIALTWGTVLRLRSEPRYTV